MALAETAPKKRSTAEVQKKASALVLAGGLLFTGAKACEDRPDMRPLPFPAKFSTSSTEVFNAKDSRPPLKVRA